MSIPPPPNPVNTRLQSDLDTTKAEMQALKTLHAEETTALTAEWDKTTEELNRVRSELAAHVKKTGISLGLEKEASKQALVKLAQTETLLSAAQQRSQDDLSELRAKVNAVEQERDAIKHERDIIKTRVLEMNAELIVGAENLVLMGDCVTRADRDQEKGQKDIARVLVDRDERWKQSTFVCGERDAALERARRAEESVADLNAKLVEALREEGEHENGGGTKRKLFDDIEEGEVEEQGLRKKMKRWTPELSFLSVKVSIVFLERIILPSFHHGFGFPSSIPALQPQEHEPSLQLRDEPTARCAAEERLITCTENTHTAAETNNLIYNTEIMSVLMGAFAEVDRLSAATAVHLTNGGCDSVEGIQDFHKS